MYTCMYNWVILLYSRILTEHHKPGVVEKIKIIIKKIVWSSLVAQGLRIWYCHCSGPGHCCGMGFIPSLGTSTCCGHGLQIKTKNFLT